MGSDDGARRLLMTLVRVLAVCGVCMGAGAAPLLLEPVLLAAFRTASLARHVNWQGYGVPGFPYRGDTVYVTAATAVLLAASSARALSMRPWARAGMAWYGIASVAHVGVLLTVPPLYAWYFEMDDRGGGGGARNFINDVRQIAVIAATVVTSLVYPVLVVVVMRHPAVTALFQREGIGFEPRFSDSPPPPAVQPAGDLIVK